MRVLIIALLAAISYAQTEQRFYAYGTENTASECPFGYEMVQTPEECEEAALALGATYSGVGNWPVPQYCVGDLSDSDGTLYFNERPQAEGVAHRRPVCIQRIGGTATPNESQTTEIPNESQTTEIPEPSVSTTGEPGQPSSLPSAAPTPIPYRVFVKFISSYGCSINHPRVSAMEWNFYDDLNATEEIASEYFNFTGLLDSPDGEMPEMLSDNDENTKWLSFLTCSGEGENCVCTNEIELHFTMMDMPTHYSFVTGDYGQGRDPAIWDITFCCAEGISVDNEFGCGEPVNVNVFNSPWSDIYGPGDPGRTMETGKFPLGGCEMGPSFAPTAYVSNRPSKHPTKAPHTSMPTAAPFSPSDEPSASPVFQEYFEWNCTTEELPTACEEYQQGLTMTCDDATPPHDVDNEFCCDVSDGSGYCCSVIDNADPQNIWVDQDVAQCTHTDNWCTQLCFLDGTKRTCYKDCPDRPTPNPSVSPTNLCVDQDQVYRPNGTDYFTHEDSGETMTCEEVVQILFTNNEMNCTTHFARQCPVACDSCTQIPTPNPSAAPSLPPQQPSSSPSSAPSRSPHPQCADDDPVIIGGYVLPANCTELTRQLLEGQPCSDAIARVCEKSCPNACTEYPSAYPHTSPSTSPSTSPTRVPTLSTPSAIPSKTPSREPSRTPTTTPTAAPNLDCVDVETVTVTGAEQLQLNISCPVAVQVVLDNNAACSGDLLRQCPDSCGTCTDEPSKSPSLPPSIDCRDAFPVLDAEGEILPNLNCEDIVFVLEEQFGTEDPCTEHYKVQCPVSCGLCTPIPTTTPVTSLPTRTPSQSVPTQAPSMNTTFVPSETQQPSAKPTKSGPYQCGDNIAQCDIGFNTLFNALVLCTNQELEDCEAVTTECPETTCPACPETSECPETSCPTCAETSECPETSCPTCPETSECPSTVEASVDTYDETQTCQTATGWWVGQVLNSLHGFDADTMALCEADGQYKISYNGKVYPTCVAYGDPTTPCTDDELVCPDHPNSPNVYGYAGNQRAALVTALLRNDFKHQDCPTIQDQCEPLEGADEGYWKDLFVQKTSLDVSFAHNLCINPATTEMRFVEADAYINTCIGFSRTANLACPAPRTFMCAGMSLGFITYGWPGQIMETLGQTVRLDSKRHPQCPF